MNTQNNSIEQRISRAKWLVQNIKHAAMATVNEDGTPHNTPYFFMASTNLRELYWGSHPDSRHSKNILRSGQLFVVLFGETEGGGLYINANNARIANNEELDRALTRHNELRMQFEEKDALPRRYYEESEQRMWIADIESLWVNSAERDADGRIRQDIRHKISVYDLV